MLRLQFICILIAFIFSFESVGYCLGEGQYYKELRVYTSFKNPENGKRIYKTYTLLHNRRVGYIRRILQYAIPIIIDIPFGLVVGAIGQEPLPLSLNAQSALVQEGPGFQKKDTEDLLIQAKRKIKSLFIVGMKHNNRDHDVFQKKLAEKASRGEIVLGIEGVPRDDEKEKKFIQNAYAYQKGLIFGFEDDFVNRYAATLLHVGYFANGLKQQFSLSKVQLVFDLRESNAVIRSWNRLKTTKLAPSVRALYDQIQSYLLENEKIELLPLVQDFNQKVDGFGNNNHWLELFKALAGAMTDEAKDFPEDLKPDIDKIKLFLQHPTDNELIDFIVFTINEPWREKFIIKNMQGIADIGAKKGLDVFFLIGSGHVSSISDKFGAIYKGLTKRVYYDANFVPEEFLNFQIKGQQLNYRIENHRLLNLSI